MDKIGMVILVVGQTDQNVKFSRDFHPSRDGRGIAAFPSNKALDKV